MNRGHVARILVVEDEPLIAMLLADWLKDLGCETLGPAHSVAEALTLINSAAPDAAIIDVSLKNEQGYPVADALRTRGIPFVFATGHGDAVATRYAGTPVLAKPFDFERFKDILAPLTVTPARD
jgi:CheY-like chemotaxis protein